MSEAEPLDLTVVILTFNEARHLRRCISSVKGLARHVVVVDSGSTDQTPEIAEDLGARVLRNPWVNYSTQFNWALGNAEITTAWTMRLDADEFVTPELAQALRPRVRSAPASSAGFSVNRRIIFLDKWIRFGGIYPGKMVRVWRTGKARCEQRWMDEHMLVDGEVLHIDADICDWNLNSVGWWTDKHNGYAVREAIDLLVIKHGRQPVPPLKMNRQARTKRWLKERVYARLPLGSRAALYFCHRYFVRFGFLDGWQGLAFHLLQGLWYRFLVDVKIYEIEQLMRRHELSLSDAVEKYSGYKIESP